MFKPVSNKTDFPKMEREILARWEAGDIFRKSLEKNKGKVPFVFYDGPPFATGLPHYGHLLAGTIKDIIPRYQTMRGKYVERRFGWDTHGLPIEALAQDALGISGAGAIREFGIDKFNEQCRSMVLRYVSEWRKTVTRMGRWVDFDNDYKTMDFPFMESVWWAFKQLWDQGRIYRSHRIMPYSWKLGTPLSNFEAGSNYKDVQDPTVTVRVKALSFGGKVGEGEMHNAQCTMRNGGASVYLLIWTTTPWTLPENLAICAGAGIDYVAVRDLTDGERPIYVMAEARLATIFKKPGQYEVVARMKGADLKGWRYEPIFPYFADKAAEGAFTVLNDDYVTTDDGTGLVHIAPAYGEDDFRVCRENGMTAFADPLDGACNFTDAMPEYAGRFCKDCDKDIIRRLKAEGKLVHQATIVHAYPFCDRTDTPLIYRAIDAWYVRVEDIRDRLAEANRTVHWTPDYVGEKRFGNWLEGARDWNISRNRFWGSCLPVWVNDADPEDMICVGSAAELEALSGVKVTDLHKHVVDKIAIVRDGKTYHRTPEVLDCWFESGSMPYAQQHYMGGGDNAQGAMHNVGAALPAFFPADFIAEGLDQTRGWFYTLMILGVCLFGESPYRNVVVNGLVLAEDGKKMSKRLKNYPDPMEVVEKYGADALRLYLINSPVVRAENLRFSEQGVMQIARDILIPLWNAYSFFVTYANVDGFAEETLEKPSGANELDRWIVSALETLVADVTAAMDAYDLQRSVRPFVDFIDALTNWYIRRSRRRFWKTQNDGDKLDAYRTLRYVLLQLSKVAAPFTPFISEAIYGNLRAPEMLESVHLCDFPEPDAAARDAALERRMARIQAAVAIGRSLRTDHDLKVRQPLARIHLVSSDAQVLDDLRAGATLVADELNIKDVAFGSDEAALADISLKADYRKLGPRFGAKMKAVAAAIAALPPAAAAALARGEAASLELPGGESATIRPDEVGVVRSPKAGLVVGAQGEIVAALETTLTPALIREGIAREFVKNVQNLRKEADFVVDQRIRITYAGDAEAAAAIEAFSDWIRGETLADGCSAGDVAAQPADLNGHPCAIAVARV